MRRTLALLCCVASLAACGRDSPLGFRLPDGRADAGREAFVALRCNACHDVHGSDVEHLGGVVRVTLGGQTTRVHTYGELVTSIINPSHRIAPPNRAEGATAAGESLMSYAYLNDVMTVRQLVDLVAFLQPTYEIVQPPPVRWAAYQ
jgi:hypothetical protein